MHGYRMQLSLIGNHHGWLLVCSWVAFVYVIDDTFVCHKSERAAFCTSVRMTTFTLDGGQVSGDLLSNLPQYVPYSESLSDRDQHSDPSSLESARIETQISHLYKIKCVGTRYNVLHGQHFSGNWAFFWAEANLAEQFRSESCPQCKTASAVRLVPTQCEFVSQKVSNLRQVNITQHTRLLSLVTCLVLLLSMPPVSSKRVVKRLAQVRSSAVPWCRLLQIVKMPPRKTKDSAASPKKERATRAKKDPNAPKKPSGAYIFFCNDKRAEVKKANPEYGVAESCRELGAMWKAASDEDKQVGVVPRVFLTVLPETRSIQVKTSSRTCCRADDNHCLQKYFKQAEKDKERYTKEAAA